MNILGLLGVALIVLKLCEVKALVGVSWWLVTLPLWGGLALVLALAAFGLVVTVLSSPRRFR